MVEKLVEWIEERKKGAWKQWQVRHGHLAGKEDEQRAFTEGYEDALYELKNFLAEFQSENKGSNEKAK